MAKGWLYDDMKAARDRKALARKFRLVQRTEPMPNGTTRIIPHGFKVTAECLICGKLFSHTDPCGRSRCNECREGA